MMSLANDEEHDDDVLQVVADDTRVSKKFRDWRKERKERRRLRRRPDSGDGLEIIATIDHHLYRCSIILLILYLSLVSHNVDLIFTLRLIFF